MKGIIIKNKGSEYKITFNNGFAIIEENDTIIAKTPNSKTTKRVYKKRGKSAAAKKAWETRRRRLAEREAKEKEKDKYEGLAKLNQNLDE